METNVSPKKRKRSKPSEIYRTINLWKVEDIKKAWKLVAPNIIHSQEWPYCWIPADHLLTVRGSGITMDSKKGYIRFCKQPYTDYNRFTLLHHLSPAFHDTWTGGRDDISHKKAVEMISLMDVSHLCRCNHCCNPEHLILEQNSNNKNRNGCCSRVSENPLDDFPFKDLIESEEFKEWFDRKCNFVTCQHDPKCLTTPISLKRNLQWFERACTFEKK